MAETGRVSEAVALGLLESQLDNVERALLTRLAELADTGGSTAALGACRTLLERLPWSRLPSPDGFDDDLSSPVYTDAANDQVYETYRGPEKD